MPLYTGPEHNLVIEVYSADGDEMLYDSDNFSPEESTKEFYRVLAEVAKPGETVQLMDIETGHYLLQLNKPADTE